MRRALLRFLRRHGVIPYEPYACRVCGHTVPLIGSRWDQAGLAVDHWWAAHEGVGATPEGNKE